MGSSFSSATATLTRPPIVLQHRRDSSPTTFFGTQDSCNELTNHDDDVSSLSHYSVDQQDVVESIDESEINELSAKQEQENEFIESLPVNIPVVKEENPVAVQRFQGVTFDPKAEPENYEVVPVADPEPVVKPEEISNASSKEIIVSNQKNIDKVNELKSQQEILELQKTHSLQNIQKAVFMIGIWIVM